MNLAAEIAAVTTEDLTAAFRASRLRFTQHYGLLTALQKPAIRRALELHAVAMRRAKQKHNNPTPTKQEPRLENA